MNFDLIDQAWRMSLSFEIINSLEFSLITNQKIKEVNRFFYFKSRLI